MKLFIAHVGFYDNEVGIYELHTNYFVVAENVLQAKERIESKPVFVKRQMHIDAIQEIVNIDGYEISVSKQSNEYINKSFDYTAVKKLA